MYPVDYNNIPQIPSENIPVLTHRGIQIPIDQIPNQIAPEQRVAFVEEIINTMNVQRQAFLQQPHIQRLSQQQKRYILIPIVCILLIISLKVLEPRFSSLPRTLLQLALSITYVFSIFLIPGCFVLYRINKRIIELSLIELSLNTDIRSLIDQTAAQVNQRMNGDPRDAPPRAETTTPPVGGGFKAFSGTGHRLGSDFLRV